MSNRPREGFIIVVVLSLLGVMAFLGVSLVLSGNTTVLLSQSGLLKSRAWLLARSGIEYKKERILDRVRTGDPADPVVASTSLETFKFQTAQLGFDRVTVWAQDMAGCLNVNDGIRAGTLELGNAYTANAVDPWPESLPGVFVDNPSAQANLRLRRLLNAYGDAHKFVADIGWPNYDPPAVQGVPDGPHYGTPCSLTSTAAGDRYTSMPGRDAAGGILTLAADIAADSTGLGDRIIAARPDGGWRSLDELKDIVDAWGTEFLPTSYLGSGTFFELTTQDLTTVSWEDDSFFRIDREFGADTDTDGYPDFQNDHAWPRMSPRGIPGTSLMNFFDTDPPDLSSLWRPSSAALVNLNAASELVRAAVFYGCVNTSYSCEGAGYDVFEWPHIHINSNASTSGGINSVSSPRESLGTGGPVFMNAWIRENGVGGFNPSTPMLPHLQSNRLMSLRDALMLSQAYAAWGRDDYGLGNDWPGDPEMFTKFLREARYLAQPLERAEHVGGAQLDESFLHGRKRFDQTYLEATLPHVLSCQRRLPGWLMAPIALMSPYIGQGETFVSTQLSPPTNTFTYAKRSAEDFVLRHHLPKACFLPTGCYRVNAVGEWNEQTLVARREIIAEFRLFETRVARTQKEFVAITDPATDATISIGPEPSGVVPSAWLGTVGLKDRGEKVPGPFRYALAMPFDDSVDADTTDGNLTPMDPSVDPELGTGLFPQTVLKNSHLEGEDSSLFEGPQAKHSNLSPFGGVILDSRGHGLRGVQTFTDSLYLRPKKQMLAGNGLIGSHCNQGLISLWARVPSGYMSTRQKRNIFHMTFWESVEIRRNSAYPTPPPTIGDPAVVHARPVSLSACWLSKQGVDHAHGALHDVEYTYVVGQTGPNPLPNSTYLIDPSTMSGLSTVPFPATQSGYLAGFSPYYSRTMGSNLLTVNLSPNPRMPLSDWHLHQTEDPHTYPIPGGGGVIAVDPTKKNLETTIRQVISPNATGWPVTPYKARPGSWVRLVFRWDFSDWQVHGSRKIQVVPHHMRNFGLLDFGWGQLFAESANRFRTMNGIFNPKMMISFGERILPRMKPASVPHALEPSVPLAQSSGEIAPFERLNSSLDNIVMVMGDLPNPNFAADVPVSFVYEKGFNNMFDAVQNLPGFDSVRYDVASEPRWVVDPGLPSGSRLLTFGARIYDVPRSPQMGAEYAVWTIKSPRVDVDVLDSNIPLTHNTISDAVSESGVTIKSPSWKGYGDVVIDANVTFSVSYRATDPNGDGMGKRLADIPWIEDLSWRYVPPGSVRILSWNSR